MNSLLPLTTMTAIAPVPALTFLLQVVGVASAVGTAVALRAHRRWGTEAWPITAAWATSGLAVGAAVEAAVLILDSL